MELAKDMSSTLETLRETQVHLFEAVDQLHTTVELLNLRHARLEDVIAQLRVRLAHLE